MRRIKGILLAILAVLAVSMPANAQFRFGIKAGMNINSLHFSKDGLQQDLTDKGNRTGFTAGLTTEFTIPVIGLGFDLSAMYVHRINEVQEGNQTHDVKGDYIEIPLNLKYKLGLPVIGKFVTPYLTTGPSIAFLCSKNEALAAFEQKKFDAAWNVGGGLLLLNHLQIGVNYGWGMTKAFKPLVGNTSANVGRLNNWTISAAYFF